MDEVDRVASKGELGRRLGMVRDADRERGWPRQGVWREQ